MGIFDGLEEQNLADTTTDPKRLFRALVKPSGLISGHVWDTIALAEERRSKH